MTDLIYDIGMHNGDDTAFYLGKGFRVVAVEADPETCRSTAERFRDFLETGQLTIVNRAIAPSRGPVTFYRSSESGRGTIVTEWNADNVEHGLASEPIVVEGITMADLVGAYGDAFYMKVDIEGMDRHALLSLAETSVRPNYVSMETSFARDPAFGAVKEDFELLARLGYDRFKIIDQRETYRRSRLNAPLADRLGPITSGPSGPFGEDSRGPWLTLDGALDEFAGLIRRKWLQLRLYSNRRYYSFYCRIMFRLTGRYPNLGWYDVHAKHSNVR